MKDRLFRVARITLIALVLLVVVTVGISAFSNINLPTHSKFTDHLSDSEKARLQEAIQLRQTLGDAVWPEWGRLDIPIVVYNEEYAFLVGYPDPPAGWLEVPERKAHGGPWEAVPDDDFGGRTYYRQRLTDPAVTPEFFTVLIGETWAASAQTKEYAEISFYAGLHDELPPVLDAIFPYRLAWRFLMGETESYIGGIEHEAFHAFQGNVAPSRLADAEAVNRQEDTYPWQEPTLEQAWQSELDLLVQAVRAESDEQTAALVSRFLEQRNARRREADLSAALIDYERQREWLEGLAKYTELQIGLAAANAPDYSPWPGLSDDPSFQAYNNRQRVWSQQIDEVKRTGGRSGDTRFYYSGMAQAELLDRLLPNWKDRAMEPGVMLEELLAEAVQR